MFQVNRRDWMFLVLVMGVTASATADDSAPPPAAPAEPVAAPAAPAMPDLGGSWRGSWSSTESGHRGPMNATLCRIDACHYQAHFNGRFLKMIPFKYTATLTVTGVDAHGRVLLSGSHRLGPILGTFSYNAWATETQFVAAYCSEKDYGQFSFTRCCR